MFVLITYDVSTLTREGRRRLRAVARACEDWGQRVQQSVFECRLDPGDFARLKKQLIDLIDTESDSLRFYNLGAKGNRRIEHVGAKPSQDLDGPLIL